MNFIIREANVLDVNSILELIKALADYEKLSDEVVATAESIKAELFCEKPSAKVYIAEGEGKVIGFSLFFINFSTFLSKPGIYLEDLFVYPDYRGLGVGKALLKNLASVAVEKKYGRLEWSVLDWNTPAIEFYESIGAKPQKAWTVYRMTEEEFTDFSES